MPTLVYSPDISIQVETTSGDILDLSDDLVSGSIMLRENAPHTANWVLQNTQRKYDGRIAPMDKVSIQLKRLNWVQIMTGYMNDPPIFQAFPGTLSMSASCTLKIPQFFLTDTTTSAFQTMVMTALGAEATDAKGVDGNVGLSRLIVDAMTKVMGWDKERIHIGEIPKDWFKFVQPVFDKIKADEAIYKAIGPSYTAAGSYDGVTTVLQPGSYAGYTVGKVQARNLSVIISTALSYASSVAHLKSVATDIAIMCVMCVMTESSGGLNYANTNVPSSLSIPHDAVGSDHASVGVFQQQTGTKYSSATSINSPDGWGAPAALMDIPTATKKFLDALVKKLPSSPSGDVRISGSSSFGELIQSVQGSAPDAYQGYVKQATEVVTQALTIAKNTGGTTASVGGGLVTAPSAGTKVTGSYIAKVALDLIASHTKDPISYSQGQRQIYTTPKADVKYLDCSSLVDWVYYNATGDAYIKGGTNVQGYYDRCTKIPYEAAKYIQGAVLIEPPNGHIAVSTGDGTCVAAKTDDAAAGKQVVSGDPDDGQGFTVGALLPKVDYSSSAVNKKGQDALRNAGVSVKGLAAPLSTLADPTTVGDASGGTSGSPFEELLNNVIINGDVASNSGIGNAIGGKAALINDQPFLPWLQAVINSSMRSFCSAPNGDMICWFPDYFDVFQTSGVMNVERIELQNFQVNWSDQALVTHQFVIGNPGATLLDPNTGAVGTNNPVNDLLSLATGTAGIASLDFPEIFNVIYGETASTGFAEAFLSRFGARVDVQQLPNVPKGASEFFMAVYLFVQRWAGQFNASVPMTFMPELFPGMLLRIPDYGFQAYVQAVTHSFSFGDGGSFTTSADICAPSNLGKSDRTDLLSLLPLGGRKAS